MPTTDPAFLWETEAIRASAEKWTGTETTRQRDPDWVTLRAAHEATGIPLETIRKWARRDSIDSYLDVTSSTPLRLVSISDVHARAELLGREIEPVAPSEVEVDESAPGQPPPGTMIVPIAAWDKMLMQLGNLHEAGQQLAEARERAARAETEAVFLRERLSELRAASETAAPPQEADATPGSEALWRYVIRRLRALLP